MSHSHVAIEENSLRFVKSEVFLIQESIWHGCFIEVFFRVDIASFEFAYQNC